MQTDAERALEHLERGNELQAEEHAIAAMDEYKEAVRLNPNLAEAHLNLGLGYADAGDLDQAIKELDAAYRLDPEDDEFRNELVEALNERGVQANAKGDSAQALADWRAALEIDDHNPDAHYNLGSAFADMRDYQAAEEHLHAAVSADPMDLETRYLLASVLVELDREDSAVGELREALSIGSRFNQTLSTSSGSGVLPLDAQFDGETLERNAALLSQANMHLAQIARALAGLQLERGDYDEAASALEQAPFTPEEAPLWLEIGRAYIDKGRIEDATLALRRAYQSQPDLAEARELMDSLGVPYQEPPSEEELEEDETNEKNAADER